MERLGKLEFYTVEIPIGSVTWMRVKPGLIGELGQNLASYVCPTGPVKAKCFKIVV